MIFVRRIFLFCAILSLVSPAAFAQQDETPPSVQAVSGQTEPPPDPVKLRKEAFDAVWVSVSLYCFDEKICGQKWERLKEKYEPRVALVKTDDELHILLQTMLNELETSHLRIIPTNPGNGGAPHKWGIGADVELIGSQLVVNRVSPDSPAAKAGLRPGFIITGINDRDVGRMIDEYTKNPLWAGKSWRNTVKELIRFYYLNGPKDSEVKIEYLDTEDAPGRVALRRSSGDQPPKIFEQRMLEGGIGYLKLSAFDPSVMPEFCRALRAMSETPAIILDLRGNPGGVIRMSAAITGLMTPKPVKLGRIFRITSEENSYLSQDETIESYPQARPYGGKVVVLIDEASRSTSEILSASLRESGRAVLVGERTGGEVMPSLIFKLPTPALFQVATSEFETASGVRLEGRGVAPDVPVVNGRRSLLENTDHQLQRALELIREGKIFNDLKAFERPSKTANKKTADATAERISRTPPDAEVRDILERYISAVGGKEAPEKINSRVLSGTIQNSQTGIGGKFVLYDKLPGRSMIIIRYDDGTVEQEAVDGTDGWAFHSQLGFRKYKTDPLARNTLLADFYPALNPALQFEGRYAQMFFVKERSEQDKKALTVLARGENDDVSDLIEFDRQTGFLIRKGIFEYGDYRPVGNVRMPFSIKVAGVITYTISEARLNVEITDETFEKPVPSCFMLTDR